ncbi:MAG: recombination protein RecR [Parcubacteria group bacterium GW2011_GWA2_38_13b]|nr:MAG: recombination protein RecR [Parcubacteria group bacterium GW2011_GWA2_38_13b]
MFPPNINNLIELFGKFPGIGPRQAARFVFYLFSKSQAELDELAEKIKEISKQFHTCPVCLTITDNTVLLCHICRDQQRNKEKLCIVEKDYDIQNIENAHIYDGLYFVVGKINITNDQPNALIEKLMETIKNNKNLMEIIIALNPTTKGDAATMYIEKKLKNSGKKISRLGRGLPFGGEIEYADEITLANSFKNRG